LRAGHWWAALMYPTTIKIIAMNISVNIKTFIFLQLHTQKNAGLAVAMSPTCHLNYHPSPLVGFWESQKLNNQ